MKRPAEKPDHSTKKLDVFVFLYEFVQLFLHFRMCRAGKHCRPCSRVRTYVRFCFRPLLRLYGRVSPSPTGQSFSSFSFRAIMA